MILTPEQQDKIIRLLVQAATCGYTPTAFDLHAQAAKIIADADTAAGLNEPPQTNPTNNPVEL